MFNALNCTCGVSGRLLLVVSVSWKYKLFLCVTVRKKNVALTLLRARRAAGIWLNMLKNNIEMDIKKLRL